MQRYLLLIMLLVPIYSFGQTIVWKTGYQNACERTGVIYSSTERQVCSFNKVVKGVIVDKINVYLCTYKELGSVNTIQDFYLKYSNYNKGNVRMNCSELDSIISAIETIANNKDYMYIVETGTMKISGGDDEGWIKIYYPAEGSLPGDFLFSYQYDIKGEELVKVLNDVKAAM